MRIFVCICTFLMVAGNSFGQPYKDSADIDQLELPVIKENQVSDSLMTRRVNTQFNIGTSFLIAPGNFYGPSMYAAPMVSYRLNPRISLSAGAGIEYGRYTMNSSSDGENIRMLPMTQVFLFARGSYQMSDRLTLGTTARKSFGTRPLLRDEYGTFHYNYQAVSIDLQYKISPAFSIGVEMRFQNHNYSPQFEGIPPEGYVPGPF